MSEPMLLIYNNPVQRAEYKLPGRKMCSAPLNLTLIRCFEFVVLLVAASRRCEDEAIYIYIEARKNRELIDRLIPLEAMPPSGYVLWKLRGGF